MLPLILAIIVFVTVVLVVFSFGAAAVTPTSMLGARLRALGGQQTQHLQEKPALRERFEQAQDIGLPDVAEALRPVLEQTQDHVRDLRSALGE